MSEANTVVEVISAENYDDRMSKISKGKVTKIPRELSRAEVVSTFQECFENIGGVPRMAVWAGENPGDFYKLYARLLPSQASSVLGEKNEFVIRHVLPKGELDE